MRPDLEPPQPPQYLTLTPEELQLAFACLWNMASPQSPILRSLTVEEWQTLRCILKDLMDQKQQAVVH